MNDPRYIFSRTIDAALDRAFLWFGCGSLLAASVFLVVIALRIAMEAGR